MKNILRLSSIFLITSYALAGDLPMTIKVDAETTTAFINKIDNVNIKTAPVSTIDLRIYFEDNIPLLGGFELYHGMTTKGSPKESGTISTGEAAVLKYGINRSFGNIRLNADYYKYSTELTATQTDVYLVTKENTTAVTGHMTSNYDVGLYNLNIGDSKTVGTEILNIEAVFNGDKDTFASIFYEKLQKPWADPTSNWRNATTNTPVTVVYADTLFKTIGFKVGQFIDDEKFPTNYLFPKKFVINFGFTDIKLTDNYSMNDFLQDEQTIMRMGLDLAIAYKMKLGNEEEKRYAIFTLFGKYNYYEIDDSRSNDSNNNAYDIKLSSDYFAGAQAMIRF